MTSDVRERTQERPRLVPIPLPRRRRRLRWALAFAAASAVLVVFATLNEAPPWTALPSAGSGIVIVDGVSIRVEDTPELTRRLVPGSRVRLESTQDLDIVSSGVLAMQIVPGTELTLPAPPGRWFSRSAGGSIDRGLLRLTTGHRFHGSQLAITTPEAMVRVTGTTLAVIAEPAGTCVCVLEGTAHVRPHGGGMTPVSPGTRCEIARGEGQAPKTAEIRGAERPKLQDLRDRLQAVMN